MNKQSIERLERRQLLTVAVTDDVLEVAGTDGNDTITIKSAGSVTVVSVNGDEQSFSNSGFEAINVAGGDGNDRLKLIDTTVPATVLGGNGNDTLIGGNGDDAFDGGADSDTLDYTAHGDDLNFNMRAVTSDSGGTDDFQGIETILCGSGDDTLDIFRFNSGNTLYLIDGGDGDDELSFTDATNDPVAPTVHGGEGNDTLSVDRPSGQFEDIFSTYYYGDAGNDVFRMSRNLARRNYSGGSGTDLVDYRGFSTAGGLLITLDDQVGDGPGELENVGSDVEIVYGSPWNDTIVGDGDDETFWGGSGQDSLVGNGGDDYLVAGAPGFSDTNGILTGDPLIGGTGDDTLEGGGRFTSLVDDGDTIVNMGKDAVINEGQLQILGFGSNDVIKVRLKAGDADTIEVLFNAKTYEFAKADVQSIDIEAGPGDDLIEISQDITLDAFIAGDSTPTGNGGNDTIFGGGGNDTIYSGGGTDSVDGGGGSNTIDAVPAEEQPTFTLTAGVLKLGGTSEEDNFIIKFRRNDPSRIQVLINGARHLYTVKSVKSVVIDGKADDDIIDLRAVAIVAKIRGGEGNDTIYGSKAADRISGNDGNDWINGDAGADVIYGDAGTDRLFGAAGKDFLKGGDDADTLRGGDAIDQIVAIKGEDDVKGNKGDKISFQILV